MSVREVHATIATAINQACDGGSYNPLDLKYMLVTLPTWMSIGVSSLLHRTTAETRSRLGRRYAVILSRCWDRHGADWNGVARSVITAMLTHAMTQPPTPVPEAIRQLIITTYHRITSVVQLDKPDDIGTPLIVIATLKGSITPSQYPSNHAAMSGVIELAQQALLLQGRHGSRDPTQFINKLTLWLVKDTSTDGISLLTTIFEMIEDNLKRIASRPL